MPQYPLRNHAQAAKPKMPILLLVFVFCANSVIMTFQQKANIARLFCLVVDVKR